MKPITPHPARADRQAYAIDRMRRAAQRLLQAGTMADEIRAGQWVLAWAIAAGVRSSGRAAVAAIPFVSLNLH
ncbi:hypothetical protein FHW58_003587 [Duganella sp. 1224]|uniref:hypothetical protein n=1 Tax=Duganella sp. 1224 TaxID=2587052 RepID=UPI0015CECA81|nr:hypothetical protein [Duganella sp. 1224]NYE62372.1 hypothetical protein [Duganella sp. 1224]